MYINLFVLILEKGRKEYLLSIERLETGENETDNITLVWRIQ